jgi:nicotinate-nucleotide adenylyltransferase
VGASFAVETVRELGGAGGRWEGAEFFYFIGDDNVADLGKWREIEALRELVTFVVLARGGSGGTGWNPSVQGGDGMPVVRRVVEISSTEVRNRVARGRSIQYLCPQCVCAVIARENLYVDG